MPDTKLTFLVEIGSEEIPDWMIVPALEHLRGAFEKMLEANRLPGQVEWVDATPRRLVLMASGMPERQADAEEQVSGPPKTAGAGAVAGFAKKQGIAVEDLQIVATAKGEYYSFRRTIAGRSTRELLAEALPGMILSIPWPKTMYWLGKGTARFIRPLRWIVALLGDEVVPFELAGIAAGRTTVGHRRFGAKALDVTAASYVDVLASNGVVVHAADRRAAIAKGIATALPAGHAVKEDAALLETLTYLTERPAAILGGFDAGYLELPSEVLVTVMRHHQRYFSVVDGDGKLAPYFVTIMNVPGDPDGLVRDGNERVLRARFNDARFFWNVDQNRTLADRVEDLKNVTFHRDLGSYFAKTERNVDLVKTLGGNEHAQRAALLAKCDLTAEMVKEFTELQGVVGGLYADAQGEAPEVGRAIYEHYKPLSMDDSIPAGATSQIVALADKLDTLRESFRIGLVPSGSKDPFALRRAAQGALKILAEGELDQPLLPLLNGDAKLVEFFEERVRYYFREIRGFAYDEVNAAMAAGWDRLPDLAARLSALKAVRPTADFEPLAAAFKRIRNILKQAGFEGGGAVDAALLEAGPEQELHAAFVALAGQVRGAGDYGEALAKIATLRPAVDRFFDSVLVNAKDDAVRANRLTMLDEILREFSTIADFSEIVTGG